MYTYKVQTGRRCNHQPGWNLVFEWEDTIIDLLHCDFFYENKYSKYKNGFVKYLKFNPFKILDFLKNPQLRYLRFDMNAKDYDNYYNKPNMIHWIIDFWIPRDQLKKFEIAYNRCPLTLISSLEAYELLKQNNVSIPIVHLPLSISDKYRISPETRYDKDIDFLFFGRPNPVILEYCEQYSKEEPSFSYVTLKIESDHFNYYDNKGRFVGDCTSREDGLNLLRRSKIGMYTTPSMDCNKPGTNGYNQVTPRFLELISSGCHIVARYAENADTRYYELDKFCHNTESYSDFKKQIKHYLNCEVDMEMYSDYLNKHYTSRVIGELGRILNRL